MKKLAWFAIVAFLLISFSGTSMAVERDYRLFLNNGSWVRTVGNPELVDGKAKVRMPAGQLVVFPQDQVDWDRTHEWNEAAATANITTNLPLPKDILYSPVVVSSQNLETVGDAENLTAGDPRERLEERIKEIEALEAVVARKRDELRKRIIATQDQEKRLQLGVQLRGLDDEFRALRSNKNGLQLQLNNWSQ